MSDEIQVQETIVITLADDTEIAVFYESYLAIGLLDAMETSRGLGHTITLSGENWPMTVTFPLDSVVRIVTGELEYGYD